MNTLTGRTTPGARPPVVEVIFKEPLKGTSALELARVLDSLLALRPDRLIIDLSDCPFIDAAAVDVLIDAHRRAWRAGGLLTLRSPSPRVRRLLLLSRADHVLHITEESPQRQPAGDRPEREGAA